MLRGDRPREGVEPHREITAAAGLDQGVGAGGREAAEQLDAALGGDRRAWRRGVAGGDGLLPRLPLALQIQRPIAQEVGGQRQQPGRVAGQGRLGHRAAGQIEDGGLQAIGIAEAIAAGIGRHGGGDQLEAAEIEQLGGGRQARRLHHAEAGTGRHPLTQQGGFDRLAHVLWHIAQQAGAIQPHQLRIRVGGDPEHRVGGRDVGQFGQQRRFALAEFGQQLPQAGERIEAPVAPAGHRREHLLQRRGQLPQRGGRRQRQGIAAARQQHHRLLAPAEIHLGGADILAVAHGVEAFAADQQVATAAA